MRRWRIRFFPRTAAHRLYPAMDAGRNSGRVETVELWTGDSMSYKLIADARRLPGTNADAEGETILDNTMGSGSTIVAAIQEGT
jgi:hypothetical protein